MSTTTSVPVWPVIEAVTRPDGTGELTINGTSHPIQAPTIEEARQKILDRIAETAAKLQRPVRALASGPDGQWPLIVHPDGDVEPDDSRPAISTPAPALAPAATVEREAAEPEVAQPAPPLTERPGTGGTPPVGGGWARTVTQPDTTATPAPETTGGAAVPFDRPTFLGQEEHEEPARQGWRGALTRVGMRVSPGQAEQAERADVHAVSQHWPGPRTIAVVNGKGGASKTPATILLAAIFARYGGAGVVAWDNNQTRGTLGWRTETGPHEGTLLDLLPRTGQLLSARAQAAELANYVHHQTRDRYDVLRSKPMVMADEQRLAAADVDAIHAVVTKYYRLIIMDSGNDESDPMWRRMIDHADQLVVVTTTRDDHAEAGVLLLEALTQRDEHSADLARGAVAIVSQADPNATRAEVSTIADGYARVTKDVVTIPHDPAMVDGILRYDALRSSTQRAWLSAGAAVARQLTARA
jgi:MinD-like ATPase involved in chromosome partitioning or flagellar assembly